MATNLECFKEQFDTAIKETQRYAFLVRAHELQQEATEKLSKLLEQCIKLKEQAIAEANESHANAFLAFEFMIRALTAELRCYILLKDDEPDRAWNSIIDAQSLAASAMKSHSVAAHLDGYIERLHALEQLVFPQQVFLSSCFIVRESECSICGSNYGDCDHIKGRPYMGKLCSRIVKKADLKEVSVVEDPADRRCRAVSFSDGGTEKNTMTHRSVSEPKSNLAPPEMKNEQE